MCLYPSVSQVLTSPVTYRMELESGLKHYIQKYKSLEAEHS